MFPTPPVPILLFPVKRGTERLWDSSRGADLTGCASGAGPGRSWHGFPRCVAAGLPKPTAVGASTAVAATVSQNPLPELRLRNPICPFLPSIAEWQFILLMGSCKRPLILQAVASTVDSEVNEKFCVLESHPVLWPLSCFSFPPLSQSVEGRKSPVTQMHRPKKGPICFV